MPLTFPAHQGLILPVKLRWPAQVDATALCIGAAAPDLAYAMGTWLNRQSHTVLGVVIWAVPFAVVAAIITRRWAASGIFACLPDLGPLRLRSYRVLSARRPALWHTVASATLGAASHVFIDGFTHAGRWGANWLGLGGVAFTAPLRGTMTWARVLQYLGHGLGTLLFILVLVVVSSRRLETWYGKAALSDARSVRASPRQSAMFALIALAPPLFAVAIAGRSGIENVFLAQTVFVPSLLLSGTIVGRLVLSDS
jgi:hypothetical protein